MEHYSGSILLMTLADRFISFSLSLSARFFLRAFLFIDGPKWKDETHSGLMVNQCQPSEKCFLFDHLVQNQRDEWLFGGCPSNTFFSIPPPPHFGSVISACIVSVFAMMMVLRCCVYLSVISVNSAIPYLSLNRQTTTIIFRSLFRFCLVAIQMGLIVRRQFLPLLLPLLIGPTQQPSKSIPIFNWDFINWLFAHGQSLTFTICWQVICMLYFRCVVFYLSPSPLCGHSALRTQHTETASGSATQRTTPKTASPTVEM